MLGNYVIIFLIISTNIKCRNAIDRLSNKAKIYVGDANSFRAVRLYE